MAKGYEECPEDSVCDCCGKVSDDLTYYSNDIWGSFGYLCNDCISNAEMEL
jgi:hypothetical protein